MDKNQVDLAVLTAKLGYFFANCDNDFDEREKKFISDYVDDLLLNEVIDDELAKEMLEYDYRCLTISELVDSTNLFLSKFNKEEQYVIYKSLFNFIKRTIEIDGVIADEEKLFFKEWQTKCEKSK